MSTSYDIAIIGAGMAGASLAAELAGSGRIVLLEAEDRPGYHATGRSAAFWHESYGGPGVQPITAASEASLRHGGFLKPRVGLTIGRAGQEELVEAFVDRFSAIGVDVSLIGREALLQHVPGLREEWTCGALEPACSDIDVAALHQHYLSAAGRGGVELMTRKRLVSAKHRASRWSLDFDDGSTLHAGLLVDAAGAWADTVAQCAGVAPLGISPLRRTMVQLRVDPPAPADLPLVLDIAEQFYFKPEAGSLWLSPHDEIPSPPVDAAPEEIDIAVAIDRFQGVVDWTVEKVEHRWAGLRSFAPDRLPVYGRAPVNPDFFWFAGQGGFGIQTAPEAARLGAGLIRGDYSGPIDPQRYSPDRFA